MYKTEIIFVHNAERTPDICSALLSSKKSFFKIVFLSVRQVSFSLVLVCRPITFTFISVKLLFPITLCNSDTITREQILQTNQSQCSCHSSSKTVKITEGRCVQGLNEKELISQRKCDMYTNRKLNMT